jgi:hypothetical protein
MFDVQDRTNGDYSKILSAFNELGTLGIEVRISEMTVSAYKN